MVRCGGPAVLFRELFLLLRSSLIAYLLLVHSDSNFLVSHLNSLSFTSQFCSRRASVLACNFLGGKGLRIQSQQICAGNLSLLQSFQ